MSLENTDPADFWCWTVHFNFTSGILLWGFDKLLLKNVYLGKGNEGNGLCEGYVKYLLSLFTLYLKKQGSVLYFSLKKMRKEKNPTNF